MLQHLLVRNLRILLREGNITLHLPDRKTVRIGDGSGRPVTVRLTHPGIISHLVWNPELALGEGYMNGDIKIDGDDLHGLLEIAVRNFDAQASSSWIRVVRAIRMLRRRFDQNNFASVSKRNVAHHYDLSSALYDLFLDQDRQYSCAYFKHPDDSLDQAQAQKKAHIAGKLLLEPGMRVLDIGCGWGGMALGLARDYGVNVLGVTLSKEQHRIATERAHAEGLADRVIFQLRDYRHVSGPFDRIVSVGMFEHVGLPHYGTYFETVRNLLSPDGVALIHTIGRSAPPDATNPWISRYIFPGGYIPAMSEVLAPIENANLWLDDVECWRQHYATTLRHWYDRFQANSKKAASIYDERFVRMWRFYLAASEQTFRYGRQTVFQFQLSRRQDAVPLTRDYLYPSTQPPQLAQAAE
ncbi:SAM-dependent methyltransferase [Roseobacter sp. GAI101]|uniref:SAM-dependent methyltransferase n=1 Tax=Roseobacter sp. (strain GAI101) TaxID=391589 RepID=UPI00031BD698|nr:cyclopropane-fatty-acyl-phospholipid synthase family protein [Roseobacter sp. GAI101]